MQKSTSLKYEPSLELKWSWEGGPPTQQAAKGFSGSESTPESGLDCLLCAALARQRLWCRLLVEAGGQRSALQGYLAHQEPPSPLGPP